MRLDAVADLLRELAKVKEEKGMEYGDTWDQVGAIMAILFPNGKMLQTKEHFAAWHIFDWSIGKLVRLANTDMKSEDSLNDLIVYLAILQIILNRGERT